MQYVNMYQQLTSVEQVTGSNSVCTPAFTIINSIARIRIIYCHNPSPSPKPVPKSNSKGLGLGVTLFCSATTMSYSSSMIQCSRLLHQAALWDNAELLEDLLNGEELEFINSCDSWGRSPVHAAATTESSHCLRQVVTMSEI